MLLPAIGLALLLGLLLYLGAVYRECSRAEYPPGIANPSQLRKFQVLFSAMRVLGRASQRLGINFEGILIQLITRLMPIKTEEDPELFVKDALFDGVPVRVYQPRAPCAGGRKAVVYFHGGGFMSGSIVTSDYLCRYIAKNSGAVVVSVGYRLAPKHCYPVGFQDCLHATIYFMKTALEYGADPSRVVLCGDSAGGNLAAVVSQALVIKGDAPKPLAQVLIYPILQMVDVNLPSYQQNSYVPPFLPEFTPSITLNYIRGDMSGSKEFHRGSHVPPELRGKLSEWLSAENIPEEFKARGYKPHVMSGYNNTMYEIYKPAFEASCSPLLAEDSEIRQLPKTYILTCEYDILRDDGILYRKRLEDNGVPVTWHHIKDGFHGIVSCYEKPNCKSGQEGMEDFVNFIKDV